MKKIAYSENNILWDKIYNSAFELMLQMGVMIPLEEYCNMKL